MDVLVIVRSIGERTEKLCLHQLRQELPSENIKVIRDMPLLESTRKMCEIAVKEDCKYTVMFDADYIPRIGCIQDLYEMAEKQDYRYLAYVKGTIIDKFVMEKRGDSGGPMLHPTWLMKEWLEVLSKIDNQLTPEASCQGWSVRKGYKPVRSRVWLVLHGYEQHYHDIYRSCFIYGQKLKGVRELLPRWKALAREDKDFQVALYAYQKGMQFDRSRMKAHPSEYFGYDESPFADWKKKPLIL